MTKLRTFMVGDTLYLGQPSTALVASEELVRTCQGRPYASSYEDAQGGLLLAKRARDGSWPSAQLVESDTRAANKMMRQLLAEAGGEVENLSDDLLPAAFGHAVDEGEVELPEPPSAPEPSRARLFARMLATDEDQAQIDELRNQLEAAEDRAKALTEEIQELQNQVAGVSAARDENAAALAQANERLKAAGLPPQSATDLAPHDVSPGEGAE